MADYKYGEMDITTQTETYNGFIKFVSRFVVGLIFLAIFMAIFMT